VTTGADGGLSKEAFFWYAREIGVASDLHLLEALYPEVRTLLRNVESLWAIDTSGIDANDPDAYLRGGGA